MGGFQPFTYAAPTRPVPVTPVVDAQVIKGDLAPAPEPEAHSGFDLADVMIYTGLGAIVVGIGLLSVAGGFIVGGIVAVVLGLASAEEDING
jgi:hypothetical protein